MTDQLSHFEPGILPPVSRRLEVRLAEDERDIRAAQALRYRVFAEEMGAPLSPARHLARLEADAFDTHCDHLLVLDHAQRSAEAVVGTYRLMPGARARAAGGFYSAGEFDLAPLLASTPDPARLVEVGRSCVAAGYRTNATVQMLWRGIAQYLADHDVETLFGCASFPTTAVRTLAPELAYLHLNHLAPQQRRVQALAARAVDMSGVSFAGGDQRALYRSLPPLIKGYLRLGAKVGQGAVIDEEFGTTDVFMQADVRQIPERYFIHFRA